MSSTSLHDAIMRMSRCCEHGYWLSETSFALELALLVDPRDKRPAFDQLCRDAARREFDIVMAWSVDRLGRSLQDLIGFLSEIHSLCIDLYLHQQGLDSTTPSGKALFGMLGVFAEFERAMIAERVRAGLARARASGTRLGRPRIS